jgi:dipeptidyl aminopeptidase/acylaminoacyl peptidase
MAATGSMTKPALSRRRYWLRLFRVFIIALAVALFLLPLALGFLSVWGLTRPPCNLGGDPGAFNPSYENIRFHSRNGLELDGYFIPGTNGATIINVPTFNMGRGAQLHYAQVFNEAGFHVLTFNARVCTSQGWISLGYQEVEDVQAAYDYLKTRPDVDISRVSLHGFSSASATAIMAAARMPEIRAVSAEGGYHNYNAVLELGQARNYFDALYQAGFAGGYRLITGDDMDVLSPIEVVDQFGTRPLLLIYGSKEVSLSGARQMLARAESAGVPVELWVVEGAEHGNYLSVAPVEFVRRVVGFHQSALLNDERVFLTEWG